MPNGQQPQEEVKEISAKEELIQHRIRLHNLKHIVQIEEAVIKKLEELSR